VQHPLDTRANPVNQHQLRLFAYACQRTGLDPFSKQIYAIKRGGKMTIQAGIDGLRSIAERTGQLDGSETHWCGEDGVWTDVWLAAKPPAAAKTILHRKGASHPFVGVARFADYNAGQGLWSKMPAAMIAKCSEALSLRKAFPADLSGVYSTDEMDQAVEPVTVTAAPSAPALPASR
jgi:phage recombination protein Bet